MLINHKLVIASAQLDAAAATTWRYNIITRSCNCIQAAWCDLAMIVDSGANNDISMDASCDSVHTATE